MNSKKASQSSSNRKIRSEDLIYNPLKRQHIRLVELNQKAPGNYSFRDFPLHSLPFFAAISYRWNEHLELKSISIDGKILMARSNVVECLKSFTEYRNWSFLWIDSICINQSDIHERSAQVNLMGRIYNMAGAVFIWLGEQTPELDAAFDAVERTDHEAKQIRHPVGELPVPTTDGGKFMLYQIETRWKAPSGLPSADAIDRDCKALQALARLDYWERTWIVQEIRLARLVFLVTGRRTLNWETLKVAFESLTHKIEQGGTTPEFAGCKAWTANNSLHIGLLEPNNTRTKDRKVEKDGEKPEVARLRAVSIAMSRLLRADETNDRPWDPHQQKLAFLHILQRYDYSKCSDVRDRIYALLSINGAGAQYGLEADYSRTSEELLVTAAACMHCERPGYPGNVRAMGDAEFLSGLLGITPCDHEFLQWITSRCTNLDSPNTTEFLYADGSILRLPAFCECFFEEAPIRAICDLGFAMQDKEAIKQLECGIGARASAEVHAHFAELVTHHAAWKRFMIDDPLSIPTMEIHNGERGASRESKLFLKQDGVIGVACPSARPYDRIYSSFCGPGQQAIRLVVRESSVGLHVIGRAFQSSPTVVMQPLPERPPGMVKRWDNDDSDWLNLSLISILALSAPMPAGVELYRNSEHLL